MLRSGAMLQKHDKDLFGKQFRDHITETKSKKKALQKQYTFDPARQLSFQNGGPPQQTRFGKHKSDDGNHSQQIICSKSSTKIQH